MTDDRRQHSAPQQLNNPTTQQPLPLPVIGICGYSGSGKTTVIEQVIPKLIDKGLAVAVIKHDAHGLDIDRKGKDSDRFFQTGADVLASGPRQTFIRSHNSPADDLQHWFDALSPHYDLIIVEGHKSTPLPLKIWLEKESGDHPPAEAGPIMTQFSREANRERALLDIIDTLLSRCVNQVPLALGILIGGASSRMQQPKHLIMQDGRTWIERILESLSPSSREPVLLGNGDLPDAVQHLPVLPDIPDKSGPLAGMLAAMRWRPRTDWVFLACDLPLVSPEAIDWLVSTRRPGTWASLPRLPGQEHPEPLLACYGFRVARLLELLTRPTDLAMHPRVMTPTVPEDLVMAWTNINTPDQLKKAEETSTAFLTGDSPAS